MKPPKSRTLFGLVREQSELSSASPALICSQGAFSYADLAERAARASAALRLQGVQRGDRIGIWMSNCVEWIDMMLGSNLLGAVAIPFSTWSTRNEIALLLKDSQVKVLIASATFGNRDFEADLLALAGSDGVPPNDHVWIKGGVSQKFSAYDQKISKNILSDRIAPGNGASAFDDALVLYTSGSTSHPKAVPLKNYALIENGFNIGERQGLGPEDRVLLSSPLFWAFGSANALIATFSHGATLVLLEKFDPSEVISAIDNEKCTAIYTLPAMTLAMSQSDKYSKNRLSSLRTGLTIGKPDEFRFAVDVLGADELCNIYGATETYGNCAVTWHYWPLERRAQCQGPPLPGQVMRFIDEETGTPTTPGTPGLAEVYGYTTTGYIGKSADQNEKSFTADGFYRTGDLGYLNTDGDFVFVGRVSEMIKRAGINVSPAEIESVLLRHPAVQTAAVVGVPDSARGELIVAFVIPRKSEALDMDALRTFCAGEISKYKIPDRFECCSELPLTATGKLQRRELQQIALKRARAPA